jgi:hypothetical protein
MRASALLFPILLSASSVSLSSSTPRVSAASKRGLSEDVIWTGYFCADMNISVANNAMWSYSWGLDPADPSCPTIGKNGPARFAPMVWGQKDVGQTPFAPADYLLGFNEPNAAGQSNLTPKEAAALWPQVQKMASAQGAQLVSPAVAGCDVSWLKTFFADCGCLKAVAAIAVHSYACSVASMRTCLADVKTAFPGKPIWVTEFNCGNGGQNASAAKHLAYMQEVLPALDADPDVERYAWMSGRDTKVPGAKLFADGTPGQPSVLTPLGKLYFGVA